MKKLLQILGFIPPDDYIVDASTVDKFIKSVQQDAEDAVVRARLQQVYDAEREVRRLAAEALATAEARRGAARSFAAELRSKNALRRFPWLRALPKQVVPPSDWLVTIRTYNRDERGYPDQYYWMDASFLRSSIQSVEHYSQIFSREERMLLVTLKSLEGHRGRCAEYCIKAKDRHLLEHPPTTT